MDHDQLKAKAASIPKNNRMQFIRDMRELTLQKKLKTLFEKLDSSYTVEITQGQNELGKDLLLFKQDKLMSSIIGVVVKRGDIKGDTLGEANEIIEKVKTPVMSKQLKEVVTQLRMTNKHNSIISTSFAELKVNDFLVISPAI